MSELFDNRGAGHLTAVVLEPLLHCPDSFLQPSIDTRQLQPLLDGNLIKKVDPLRNHHVHRASAWVELHDAPSGAGRFGYAVRWHGERPALLWELVPDRPDRPVRIVAPGLDPAWSSTDPVGEALLAPMQLPVDQGSFS